MIMKHFNPVVIFFCGILVHTLGLTVNASKVEGEVYVNNNDSCTYFVNKPSETISKNGTLKPSDVCTWIITGNVSATTSLFFEKVHLDSQDVLNITDASGELLWEYKGTQGPLVIAVDEQNFTVNLFVSSTQTNRSFRILYNERCMIAVPPDINEIASPIYKLKPKQVNCTYQYNYDKKHDFVSYSFVFKSFNADSKSWLDVTDAEGPNGVFHTTPPDIFGPETKFNFTFNCNSSGNNFTLVKRDLYPDCSKYIDLQTAPCVLQSPHAMTSYNDSVKFECRWLIKAPDSNTLGLVVEKLQFDGMFDILTINNGQSELSPTIVQSTRLNQDETKAQVIRTSGQYLWISFRSEAFTSNFTGSCSAGKGGYYKESGDISISSGSEATFLLEVAADEKVLLNFTSSNFGSATIGIYEDFSLRSSPIAELSGNVWYPVVSKTSKMMIVAKNFTSKTFTAEFNGTKSDCIQMSTSLDDAYIVSGNCNKSCVWVVPPKNVSEKVLLLEFRLLSLGVNDSINVFRLGDNKTPVATILPATKHVPPLIFDSKEGLYMNVSRGVCSSEDVIIVAHSTYLPGCSGNYSLQPSSEIQVSSPNYPNMYPLFANCQWNLTASGDTTQFYLAFDKMDLAPNHCIQISYTVKDVWTGPKVISGDNLPDDMLFQKVGIHFDSFNCNKSSTEKSLVSDEGFVLNVTASDCGAVMTDKSGEFNTNLPASKNKNSCFWIVQVPYTESGSVNSIMFTISEKGEKNANTEFQVHDGPSVRYPLITNYTDNIWSRNNTVIFVYKRFNSSVAATVYTVSYKTISCNISMQCDNKICLHPDWRCDGKNDCGDFTDERFCGTVPVPTPQKEPNKISSATFGVVTVLFFILGALAAFLIPKAINRYRSARYHQFQDYSNVG